MLPEQKGFNRQLRLQGRNLKVLSGPDAGQTFRGTVNRIGAFDLNTDLGPDPRGKRILETLANGCPQLVSEGTIQDTDNGEKYTLVTIGLDSPDYSKKFVIQQLVPGLDE